MVAPLSNIVAIKSNLVSNAYTVRKYLYLSHQTLMIQKYPPDYTYPHARTKSETKSISTNSKVLQANYS